MVPSILRNILVTGYYYVKDVLDSNARLFVNDYSGSCICDMMSGF